MLAAIDIYKAVFQAAVLDPDSGALVEERFAASREALAAWAQKWNGRLDVVAIEATTGWRWVAYELQARGIEVAADRSRPVERAAGPSAATEERPSRRALAGDAACARAAPASVAGAGGDSAPVRPDAAAQGARR